MKKLFFSILVFVGLLYGSVASAAAFRVNSTDDSTDGTCDSTYVDATQDCTLREAITSANTTAGTDDISFDISIANFTDDGDGQFTITMSSALPVITEAVSINASGMWDTSGTLSLRPGVRLLGISAGSDIVGININTDSVEVKALLIDGFTASGIRINGDSSIIGTDCDGASDETERNVIINNTTAGIFINTGASQNVIAGNNIGVAGNGITELGNGTHGIFITGDNNQIGYTSSTCTANTQRNIISGNDDNGIEVRSDSNRIAGNYIGLTSVGEVALPNAGSGIHIQDDSIENFIGTNSDGSNDGSEGNVIAGNYEFGIFIEETEDNDDTGVGGPDGNRISGNIIGLSASQGTHVPNGDPGITIRADDMIVGWCDATISATMCPNAGSAAAQANVIFGTTDIDGLRLGVRADDAFIYGNYFGVTSSGGNPTTTAGQNGISIAKRSSGHEIGGSESEMINTIENFVNGIRFFHTNTSSTTGSEDVQVTNNSITNNSSVGILCDEVLEFRSGNFTYEHTIKENTIADNASHGIQLNGCSLDIQTNTIRDNGGWGIYTYGQERPDDPDPDELNDQDVAGSNYDNPYDAPSPNNSSNDLISRPRILSNTISGNTNGGLYFLEASATNASTLYTDNTFSTNGNTSIKQDWYGAVELLNSSNSPISSGAQSVTLSPADGTCSSCNGSAVSTDATTGYSIWGPTNINYNNATTWFTVTDYTIDNSAVQTSNNPYTVIVSGDSANHDGVAYSFNGSNDDAASLGGASNGLSTNSLYRYQIAEVETSSVPDKPINLTPTDNAALISLTPVLTATAFSDTTHSHTASTWDVYSTLELCMAAGTGDIYSTTSTSSLQSVSIPSSTLASNTGYSWRVIYTNDFGNNSLASDCTSFTTIQTAPTFSGTISDQTWDEDESLNQAFDLDNYFSDAEGETLTFTVDNSESDSITISINANQVVSFSADDNWNGTGTVTFTACDTDSECVSSNEISLTVDAVNDAPTTPASGFSPSDGDLTSSQSPRLSWNASTDVDHATSRLQYTIRVGTNSDPTTRYSYTNTTSAGQVSHTVTDTLDDETTYYYVVRAVDPADAKSDWSDVQEFYVNTALAPDITLTKEVAQVDEISQTIQRIERALAGIFLLPIPLPVYGQFENPTLFTLLQVILHAILWLSVLSVGLLLIALLAMGRSWRDVGHILVSSPMLAFQRIHQVQYQAVREVSYYQFKTRLLFLRSIFTIAILLFASLIVVNATQTPVLVQTALRTLAETVTVEPGSTLEVTLSYENTGDGSATSPVFSDTIPSGTSFVAGSLQLNSTTQSDSLISDSTISISSPTITDTNTSTNRSGTIGYQLAVDNPYTNSSLSLAAANVTASEFAEAVESNTLTLGVSSATIGGTVSGGGGNGIADVSLYVLLDSEIIATTTTNATGSYSFDGLGDGEYSITVVAPAGYSTPDARTLTASAGTSYTGINFTMYRSVNGGDDSDEEDTTDDSSDDTSDTTDTTDDTTDDTTTIDDILTDLGVPEDLFDDFRDIDVPTEDEQQRIQELTDQLDVVTINDRTDSTIVLDSSDTALGSLIDDVADLLFPSSNDIVLEGVGPPNAKITISICYVISETSTDSEGKWVMVIPESVLQPGENVFYATAEKDGVVSEQIEVARVVVDTPSLISRTALLAYLSMVIVIITINITSYVVLERRQRKSGVRPVTYRWAWITLGCMLFSIVALGSSFMVQQWREYDVAAESRQLQSGITMSTINDQDLPAGQRADFMKASTVRFSGLAPADTYLAITLCDNQPYRKTTADQTGNWNMDIPISLLPTARFTISAQAVAGDLLGDPHRLVDLDIQSRDLLFTVNLLLVIAYVLMFVSAATLWWHSQMSTVPRNIDKSHTK